LFENGSREGTKNNEKLSDGTLPPICKPHGPLAATTVSYDAMAGFVGHIDIQPASNQQCRTQIHCNSEGLAQKLGEKLTFQAMQTCTSLRCPAVTSMETMG